MTIRRQTTKQCYRFYRRHLGSVIELRLLFQKHKYFLVCVIIILAQCFALVKLRLDYTDLYSLANSPAPDTFWHIFHEQPRVPVRRVRNVSLANEFVVVMACGRNVAKLYPTFKKNVYTILQLFKEYRILLGESDSVDDTLMSFQQWQQHDNKVYVYSYGNLSVTYSRNRAHRIAFCRNNLLQIARKQNWIHEAKFMIVMDIDINANPILTAENFLTNFEYDTRDWAVMTASQTKGYYDIWAVRSSILDYDCWALVDPLKHQDIARRMYINVHTRPIPREFGLIPVRSAFGGFGLYQTIYINNCYYEAFDMTMKQKCEHISFHECILQNGGKIFINPKFQNADGHPN